MANLPITLTCADYARLMPLAAGEVKPKGIDLTLVLGSHGSWSDRAEMLHRAMHDPAVHGGEQSMANHLWRVEAGDRSHVGLPIFPLRNFTARDLYVRKDGPVKTAADLNGKRIGMYGWANSGSVWYRHFLGFIGVDIAKIKWCIGPIDTPRTGPPNTALPPGVTEPPTGKRLSDMLIAGELEAIYSPPRPQHYHPVNGPIVRLFPAYRGLEQDYFRKTGAFPPQHLILIRRAAWEANKWIARSLTDAFIAGNDAFTLSQRRFPYASPWLDAELDETAALMGEDFHPYGLEKNREQMKMFCRQAYDAGLTKRLVTVEEYFAEFLAS